MLTIPALLLPFTLLPALALDTHTVQQSFKLGEKQQPVDSADNPNEKKLPKSSLALFTKTSYLFPLPTSSLSLPPLTRFLIRRDGDYTRPRVFQTKLSPTSPDFHAAAHSPALS